MPILNLFCPKCSCNLFIKAIDSVWCTNQECNYAELHIVGDGTVRLKNKINCVIKLH